jgi:hypothetical protein
MLTEDELKAIEARVTRIRSALFKVEGEDAVICNPDFGVMCALSLKDIPALLTEVRRLQAALAEAEAMNKTYFEAGHAVARARVAIPMEAVRSSREPAK